VDNNYLTPALSLKERELLEAVPSPFEERELLETVPSPFEGEG